MSDPTSSSFSSEKFTKLSEANFLEWKENMMGLLMAKKLWQYAAKDFEAGDINDQQAKGYIWMSIEHGQRSHVPEGANAHKTWTALCAKHEKIGPQVIANCIFGLLAARYVEGTKVEDHIVRIKEYFTRLDGVDCKLPETVKAILVIHSLPPSWDIFRQTQMAAASASNPLTVSTLCLAILQERDRRAMIETRPSTDLTNAGLAATQQTPTPRARKRCPYCQRRGHEEKTCWDKRDGLPRTTNTPQANIASSTPSSSLVFTASSTVPDSGTWYIDSGASNHYCHEAGLIKSVVTCSRPDIVSANGGRIPVVGSGHVDLLIPSTREGQPHLTVTLTDVSYAPGLATNLVSVSRLAAAGLDVRFTGPQCIVRRGKQVIVVADLVESNSLYRLRTVRAPATAPTQSQYCLAAGEQVELPLPVLWHRRLGHINHRAVAMLIGRHMAADVHHPLRQSGDIAPCEACVYGKLHRTAVPSAAQANRATRPLFRLHLDICGPFSTEAWDGSLYLLQIVDDYSRYTWARTMPNRESDTVLSHLKSFVEAAEAMHAGHRVSVLRSDNGAELVSGVVNAWLQSRGIRRELTATYTPHQNGVVERMNRTVVESARTMLQAAELPYTFWALAVQAAVYCRNRSPTTSLDSRTPYEVWSGHKPKVSHMRVFGCLAFAHVRKGARTKLDPKARVGIFVGYSPDSSTYLLWDRAANKLTQSRDVYFVERQLGIKARGATADIASPASLRDSPPDSESDESDQSQAEPSVVPSQPPQPQPNPPAAVQPRALSREERLLKDRLESGPRDHAPSVKVSHSIVESGMMSCEAKGGWAEMQMDSWSE
jgi:transposase InsO family protein